MNTNDTTKNDAHTSDDRTIVEALLRHDPFVTKMFFYRNCRPLFVSLINRVQKGGKRWEYDEVVSEVYALLMADDGRRLRSFTFSCSLYQWLKVVTLRHLLAHEDLVIDSESKEPLYEQTAGWNADDATDDAQAIATQADDSNEQDAARADLERLLQAMPNKRYAEVIRKLTILNYENEELAQEMGVKLSNLYNIKRRAIQQLSEVALGDKKTYQNAQF